MTFIRNYKYKQPLLINWQIVKVCINVSQKNGEIKISSHVWIRLRLALHHPMLLPVLILALALEADSANTDMRCQLNSSMLAQFIKSEGTEVDWGTCEGSWWAKGTMLKGQWTEQKALAKQNGSRAQG